MNLVMWTCLDCFEFVQGARDLVHDIFTTHECGVELLKELKLSNFKKFIDQLWKKEGLIAPPDPPPLPPSLFFGNPSQKTDLTWDQLKDLKTKSYAAVQYKVEAPTKKHFCKTTPAMSSDPKGFIEKYNKMNDELKQVFLYVLIFSFNLHEK